MAAMSEDQTASAPAVVPLLAPLEFAERFNASPDRCGMPYLTALDPLVMLAWHTATEDLRKPRNPFAMLGPC